MIIINNTKPKRYRDKISPFQDLSKIARCVMIKNANMEFEKNAHAINFTLSYYLLNNLKLLTSEEYFD